MSHRQTIRLPEYRYSVEVHNADDHYIMSRAFGASYPTIRREFERAKAEVLPGDIVRIWEHKTTFEVAEEFEA